MATSTDLPKRGHIDSKMTPQETARPEQNVPADALERPWDEQVQATVTTRLLEMLGPLADELLRTGEELQNVARRALMSRMSEKVQYCPKNLRIKKVLIEEEKRLIWHV